MADKMLKTKYSYLYSITVYYHVLYHNAKCLLGKPHMQVFNQSE